jgi:ankyrin repeat protein
MRTWRTTAALVCTAMLLGAGCSASRRYKDAHEAIDAGDAAAVEQFIRRDPELAKPEGLHLLLVHAIDVKQSRVVAVLLDQGAVINGDDWWITTPLHKAAWARDPETARLLIARGAQINAGDHRGWTALHVASAVGSLEIVDLLLASGADVNASAYGLVRPLMCALERNQMDVAERLIARGADLNARDEHGRSPFSFARRQGNTRIMSLLIEKGARNAAAGIRPVGSGRSGVLRLEERRYGAPNPKPENDEDALRLAAYMADVEKVKALVNKGVRINAKDPSGRTPLYWATVGGDVKFVRQLTRWGADPDILDLEGHGPLWVAADFGDPDTTELLAVVAYGDACDKFGRTPIFAAVMRGNKDAVERLIKWTADVLVEDEDGNSALDMAVDYGFPEIYKLLSGHGAEYWLPSKPVQDKTPK